MEEACSSLCTTFHAMMMNLAAHAYPNKGIAMPAKYGLAPMSYNDTVDGREYGLEVGCLGAPQR
jgi:hypothetical protein